ncbi:pH-response regulator protein palH/rim21 [Metarhizium acridum]|nr:pH-response regulator protein palH/rim21 [Metarhizium acridum]
MSTTASIVPSGTRTVSLVTSLVSTTLATTSSAILSATTTAPDPAATSTYWGDASLNSHDQANSPSVSNLREPFYATTVPMCYLPWRPQLSPSYMLLIMLFITPRSFLDGGVVYLGRRSGFTHSSSGGDNIGGRPWLQKVAALTVAVSLTIATCDTFHFLAEQYKYGAQNASVLQTEVMGSVELRVIRLVSNFFLWLAQAQTLIRLFPRHREKVIIKWVALL